MTINLIFKIAAVGDSGIDTVSGAEAQWEGRTGFSDQSCRTFAGTVLDRAVYL